VYIGRNIASEDKINGQKHVITVKQIEVCTSYVREVNLTSAFGSYISYRQA
jgi:hypothetical protein